MKRILLNYGIFILAIITLTSSTTLAVNFPAEKEFTNSVGMKFVRVESGNFRMGFEGKSLPEGLLIPEGALSKRTVFPNGDFDEHPKHKVKITSAFYMGIYEVT
ncbi:MAG: hypothetical protein ACYTBP_14780, partial [Planctomycetota bacterium]